MFRFPWHKYLGPGNEITFEDPVDEDDRIALLHDLEYAHALKKEDILHADSTAIFQFVDNFLLTGNWHSFFGVYGLLFKYSAESVTGVQYPKEFHVGRGSGSFGESIRTIQVCHIVVKNYIN